MTPIYLSDEEAKDFILFQENRLLFEWLKDIDALHLPNSDVTIRYDERGNPKRIDIIKRHFSTQGLPSKDFRLYT